MGMVYHSDQAMGTLGGTLIAFIGIVDGNDILKTGVLACFGAMVSFGVSRGLHILWPGTQYEIPKGKEKTHPGFPLEGKEYIEGSEKDDE